MRFDKRRERLRKCLSDARKKSPLVGLAVVRANPARHARSLLIYGSDSMCVLILVGNLICWLSESTFFVIVLDQKLLKHAGKDIKQSPVEKIVSF